MLRPPYSPQSEGDARQTCGEGKTPKGSTRTKKWRGLQSCLTRISKLSYLRTYDSAASFTLWPVDHGALRLNFPTYTLLRVLSQSHLLCSLTMAFSQVPFFLFFPANCTSVQSVSSSTLKAAGDTSGRNRGICSYRKYVWNCCCMLGQGLQWCHGYCGEQGSPPSKDLQSSWGTDGN